MKILTREEYIQSIKDAYTRILFIGMSPTGYLESKPEMKVFFNDYIRKSDSPILLSQDECVLLYDFISRKLFSEIQNMFSLELKSKIQVLNDKKGQKIIFLDSHFISDLIDTETLFLNVRLTIQKIRILIGDATIFQLLMMNLTNKHNEDIRKHYQDLIERLGCIECDIAQEIKELNFNQELKSSWYKKTISYLKRVISITHYNFTVLVCLLVLSKLMSFPIIAPLALALYFSVSFFKKIICRPPAAPIKSFVYPDYSIMLEKIASELESINYQHQMQSVMKGDQQRLLLFEHGRHFLPDSPNFIIDEEDLREDLKMIFKNCLI